MKTKTLFLLTLIAGALYSCGPSVSIRTPHIGIDSIATPQMTGNQSNTGFFASSVFYDTIYDSVRYMTARGNYTLANNGTYTFLCGRYVYDTVSGDTTRKLLWVGMGGGSGIDGASGYCLVPQEKPNFVFVLGYVSAAAFFPFNDGTTGLSSISCRGNTDLFLAKYDYQNGRLVWINGGGSAGRDLYSPPSQGAKGQSVYQMKTDSTQRFMYIWTKSEGPILQFENGPGSSDDMSVATDRSGFVKITFDMASGSVIDLQYPSIPE